MRASRARVLLPATLAAALLVAPAVLADHAYSHRYVIQGRVTDAAGAPLENVTVFLRVELPHGGPCGAMPDTETDAWGETTTRPRTNAFGEWSYCLHTHRLDRDVTYGIRAHLGDERFTDATADAELRRTTMHVTLPDAEGNGTAEWDSVYTVSGRVWRPVPNGTSVEGVAVYGETVNDEAVTVTYMQRDGTTVVSETRTNGYGDFAVRLDVATVSEDDRITVEAAGETWGAHPDPVLRWTDFKATVEPPQEGKTPDPADAENDTHAKEEPGATDSDAPRGTPGAGVIAALSALAAGAAALTRRRRA